MKFTQTIIYSFWYLALLSMFSCNEEDPVPITDIIRLEELATTSYFADGTTTITLRAILPGGASEANRVVTFYTTNGKFQGSNGKQVGASARVRDNKDDELIAEAVLIAPLTDDPAVVEAVVKDYTSNSLSINFTKAEPEGIDLEINLSAIPIDYTLDAFIEGSVSSATGLPSLGAEVMFAVFKENGPGSGNFMRVGDEDVRFRNIKNATDSQGKVSTFFNGSNLGPGRLMITCTSMVNPAAAGTVYLQLF